MNNCIGRDVERTVGGSNRFTEKNSLPRAREKTGAASSVLQIFCGARVGLDFRDRHLGHMDAPPAVAVVIVVAAAACSGKNLASLSGQFPINWR